jgi:hypothetical protein
MVLAVAATSPLIRALTRACGSSSPVASLPNWECRLGDVQGWLNGVSALDGLIVEVIDREGGPETPRSGRELAVEQTTGLRAFAHVLSTALRRMARSRRGHVACVIRQGNANVNSSLCESAIALIRSAAMEMEYYGISVNAVVASGSLPSSAANESQSACEMALTRAAELAYLLTRTAVGQVRGQALLLTHAQLALIAPPKVKHQLVKANRRFATPELEVLAPLLLATGDQDAPGLAFTMEGT